MPYDDTDRYALRALTGSSNVSDIDAGFAALRNDVSAKLAPFDAGIRSSRPVSTPGSPGIAGRTYRSTDDGGVDLDVGTGWVTMRPGLFSVLPTTQLDDQREILFQTAGMVTAGAGPWLLRYDSALVGTSKWRVLGADSWVAVNEITLVQAANSPYAQPAGSPSILLPAVGDYDYWMEAAAISIGGTSVARLGLSLEGAVPVMADSSESATDTFYKTVLNRSNRLLGQPSGRELVLQHSTGGNVVHWIGRRLRLRPVRVG